MAYEPTTADPTPIDADAWCLVCWEYCKSEDDCQRNRVRNRSPHKTCYLTTVHDPHGWDNYKGEPFFCQGRTEAKKVRALEW